MPSFALNHMTVAGASYQTLLDYASELGCAGVEVRNDLSGALFDGLTPPQAGKAAMERGLSLLAVAEVCEFDKFSQSKLQEASALIEIAVAAGCEAISLIPGNDGIGTAEQERLSNLRASLVALKPMLEAHSLVGLIEPLGFETATLRFKREVVAAIDELNALHCFKLVHDTFHHHLAGDSTLYAQHTGMVHISGVTDKSLELAQLRDEHRILVNEHDVLGSVAQLRMLTKAGYKGPISFEVFAPEVHAFTDPVKHLSGSINFIASDLAAFAA